MKLNEVITSKTQTILNEGWQDLNEAQQNYLTRFELELWPLVESYAKLAEAELTSDQIQAIFKGAEETAMASGDNKTALGKAGSAVGAAAKLPVDLAKKVDAKINELGKLAQNAGPIKNADAKFEELKKKIGSSDGKIVAGVKAVSDWAKANPGKASLAVGILTTVAAFAGGPLGGAAAGLVLRSTKDLLQGEKLSTAVGKSVKTAAYGALAGLAIQGLTDNMVDNIATGSEAEADAMMDAFEKANFTAAVDGAVADAGFDAGVLDGARNLKMSGNINGFFYNYDLTMTADQVAQYKALSDAASNAKVFSPEYYEAAGKLHGFMSTTQQANADLTALAKTIADIPKDALTGDQLDAAIAVLDNADKAIETLSSAGGAIGAAAQGALQTVDDNNKEMHKVKPIDPEEKKQLELDLKGGSDATPVDKNFDKSQKLSDFGAVGDKAESIDYETAFNEYLQEAEPAQGELPLNNPNTLGAKLKRGVGKVASRAAGAVAQGAKSAVGAVKQGAKDVGNKVTANKLNKDWKKMGEPTDSGSIVNILSGAGLTNDQISSIAGSTQAPISPDEVTKAPTDGATDADTASTSGDKATATQAQASTKNDKQEPSSSPTPGKTPLSYPTGTPDKPAKATGGDYAKKPKVPASAQAKAQAKQGSAQATPTQSNVATLAQKIKKSGVNVDSVKQSLGGGTAQQSSGVNLPDLVDRISKAGVQKQVRQMLIAK